MSQTLPPQQENGTVIKVVLAIIVGGLVLKGFHDWSTGSWERNSRSAPQRQLSPAEVDRLYRSQFHSEAERLQFEAWHEGQQELQRDAPIGRTRGGDTY